MKNTKIWGSLILGWILWGSVQAAEQNSVWERDTLTNGFWGGADVWSDKGVDVSLSLTDVYQHSLDGGLPEGRHTGRNTGSGDLEFSMDLQKLLGIRGATLYAHVEGSWGLLDVDTVAVGSFFGVNADAAGRRTGDVTELWYEQALFGDTLRVRMGKLDITGGFECRGCPVSFDGSVLANDETAQFLNGALVNNPTIPFPEMGLGWIVHWNPVEWWYASAGMADAEADPYQSGFKTPFDSNRYFFYVGETGVTPRIPSARGPLQGAYRVGLWYDPQPKAHADADPMYRDDVGFYFSGDQVVVKEGDDPNESQGLGLFLRYGWADEKRNDLVQFWSAGLQYQGLIPGRDDDVLAVGWAYGIFSNLASTTYSADHEAVVETYYNAQVAGWLNLSPSVQYIVHPGGSRDADNAVVACVRAQMAF